MRGERKNGCVESEMLATKLYIQSLCVRLRCLLRGVYIYLFTHVCREQLSIYVKDRVYIIFVRVCLRGQRAAREVLNAYFYA